MTRQSRRRFAILAMLGLLFAQFSLMAYACPMQAGTAVATPAAVPLAMADCTDMAGTLPDPNLCELHCTNAVKAAPVSLGDEPPAMVWSLEVLPPTDAAPLRYLHWTQDGPEALAAAPPLPIRFCRFLI
jgi:hypothetical protein